MGPWHCKKKSIMNSWVNLALKFGPFLHSKNEAKICKIQNLPISHPKVVNTWNKYLVHHFGGCSREKVVSVFWFGRSKSHFWAPENAKSAHFQVPENGTSSARIKKRRPLFHANTPPKWWTRYLFHVFTSKSDFWPFYWFWIFWLRFQLFLHCKRDQNFKWQFQSQFLVYNAEIFFVGSNHPMAPYM